MKGLMVVLPYPMDSRDIHLSHQAVLKRKLLVCESASGLEQFVQTVYDFLLQRGKPASILWNHRTWKAIWGKLILEGKMELGYYYI